jgi:hypothetical protein
MKNSLGMIIILLLVSTGIAAQQVISAAGGSVSGEGIQVSWTLGETVIETFAGTQNILTQGFHQTRLVVTAINPLEYPGLNLSVFPNPVSSVLRLEYPGECTWKAKCLLYNSDGKLMLVKKSGNLPETIGMENFAPGLYLLKIMHDNGEILKTFKIIKN